MGNVIKLVKRKYKDDEPIQNLLSLIENDFVKVENLIKQQIKISAGQKITFNQKDIQFSGHSIQCRINAEDPLSFIPSPGRIKEYHSPGGPGVRIDSALYAGCIVPHQYDNLISKVIIYSRNRNEAILRLKRCLIEYVINGIKTNIPLHLKILNNKSLGNIKIVAKIKFSKYI